MSTTLKATGDFAGATPTLTISSGRGNTGRPEIHLSLRDDSDSEITRTVFGWFDRDSLLDAITTEDAHIRRAVEIGEPA